MITPRDLLVGLIFFCSITFGVMIIFVDLSKKETKEQTKEHCLVVNYIENQTQHTVYLNVKETAPLYFETISQELVDSTTFYITEIFDYVLENR